mmetsp:Transcript_24415/g.4067  ORF Transcript_24415/g.4067 Transcript_24415/m.4067 type:complete len:104 (-) Transcript_24415:339-650(-)
MTYMLVEVAKNLGNFLIVLMYSSLGFTFLYFIIFEGNEPFSANFKLSTLLFIGEFELDMIHGAGWIIFYIAIYFNFIIMMNLLISLIGDVFDRVYMNMIVAET